MHRRLKQASKLLKQASKQARSWPRRCPPGIQLRSCDSMGTHASKPPTKCASKLECGYGCSHRPLDYSSLPSAARCWSKCRISDTGDDHATVDIWTGGACAHMHMPLVTSRVSIEDVLDHITLAGRETQPPQCESFPQYTTGLQLAQTGANHNAAGTHAQRYHAT